jgi:hypothetical protein
MVHTNCCFTTMHTHPDFCCLNETFTAKQIFILISYFTATLFPYINTISYNNMLKARTITIPARHTDIQHTFHVLFVSINSW